MVENGETLIRNGRIVSPNGVKKADVRIVGEYISEVAASIHPSDGVKVIDASGKLIISGGIDPHTHLSPPWVDDLTSGSAAALAGGITTIGTFSYTELKDEVKETLVESLHRMEARVNREAIADVILHSFIWPPSTASREQLQAILDAGQPSIKFFTLIKGFSASIKEVLEAMEVAGSLGIMVMMHCEDEALLN